MNDQTQNPETPEQRKARLDSSLPTSAPQHQSHAQHLARMQQPATQRVHQLMLEILNRSQPQDQPTAPPRSEQQ
jgi:hypothetical protein